MQPSRFYDRRVAGFYFWVSLSVLRKTGGKFTA
jgi:hypothetical protein